MGFEKIKGQEKALITISRYLQRGKFHHAYRFEGPPGVGKTMTALYISASLNCQNPVPWSPAQNSEGGFEGASMPNPCEECHVCRRIPLTGDIESNEFPDVLIIAPEGTSRVIKVEQIRQIHSIINYVPAEGKVRVIIIREGEHITEEASNAFLKVLEEPPPNNYFIITTAKPHRLLSTIKSRTVPVRFSALSFDTVFEILKGLFPEEKENILKAATALSGGSVSKARNYVIESEKATNAIQNVCELDSLIKKDWSQILSFLDSAGVDRESIEDILHTMILYYRDIIWFSVTQQKKEILLKPVEDKITRRTLSDELETICDLCLNAINGLKKIELNVNPRAILETIIFNMKRGEGTPHI